MVLALVLLPAIAQMANDGSGSPVALLWPFLLTAGKVAGFIAFVLIVGRRVIPWVLPWVAHTASRELFRLAVPAPPLAVALPPAKLFNVPFPPRPSFAAIPPAPPARPHPPPPAP